MKCTSTFFEVGRWETQGAFTFDPQWVFSKISTEIGYFWVHYIGYFWDHLQENLSPGKIRNGYVSEPQSPGRQSVTATNPSKSPCGPRQCTIDYLELTLVTVACLHMVLENVNCPWQTAWIIYHCNEQQARHASHKEFCEFLATLNIWYPWQYEVGQFLASSLGFFHHWGFLHLTLGISKIKTPRTGHWIFNVSSCERVGTTQSNPENPRIQNRVRDLS